MSFFDGSAVKYGLPLPRSRDESYVDYLARLPVDRGVLAEMVRVDGWDGPEMVASVRATRHLKNGQNYCIERFAGPLDTFRSAVARPHESAWMMSDGASPDATATARPKKEENASGDSSKGVRNSNRHPESPAPLPRAAELRLALRCS